MRYLLFLLCLSNLAAAADDVASCPESEQCTAPQQLYLNLALGLGQRSNPLNGGEKLPLVLLPDIYYYGEHWFFDNGKLGTSWELSADWTLSLVSQLNPEKGYFQKWFGGSAFQFNSGFNPSNSGFNQSFNTGFAANQKLAPQPASINEIAKRPTALDAGVQLNWFSDKWQMQANLWQDISNAYDGQHASVRFSRQWQTPLGNWQLSAGVLWKSAKLIDTYYGIDNNEAFYLPRYNGTPSWQPEVRINWQRPITERIALLAFFRYLHLDDAMTDSPLVHKDNVTTSFIGVSYRLY